MSDDTIIIKPIGTLEEMANTLIKPHSRKRVFVARGSSCQDSNLACVSSMRISQYFQFQGECENSLYSNFKSSRLENGKL